MPKCHFESKVGNARVCVHQGFTPGENPTITVMCAGEELRLEVDQTGIPVPVSLEIKVVTD